jgi:hypothetical protein
MQESTPLTRQFAAQGVCLRLRKKSRTLLGNRGPASDNYEPRTYANGRQQQSRASKSEIIKKEGLIHCLFYGSQHSQAGLNSESHDFPKRSDLEEHSCKRSWTGSERISPQSYGQPQYPSQIGSEQICPLSSIQQGLYQTPDIAQPGWYSIYYPQFTQITNQPRDLPLDFSCLNRERKSALGKTSDGRGDARS